MKLLFAFLLLLVATAPSDVPQWTLQSSGLTARLRGVSAVSERVAWASGSGSTVLRTTDGGVSWQKLTVTADQLDFRDIDAVDAQTAYVLSIGNGSVSRIYKTSDAGATWTEQFRNVDPKGFLDSMSFWDSAHGIVIGDSIEGQFYILTTENGGRSWQRTPSSYLPPALDNEGAFAASGTNIALYGKTHAWIATGGGARARVLRSGDRGRTWKLSETPIAAAQAAGIFSIAFRDEKHGVIVGGDYTKEKQAQDNLALTDDGGITWTLVKGLSGYRSVVAFVPSAKKPTLIAVGPSGADYSADDGRTWNAIVGPGFDTLSFLRRRVRGAAIGWAAGSGGRIGRVTM
ncbi:MAG: YCF48-related protein [Acidobacteriota bacterium]